MSALPDEIVSEILHPALEVDDTDFSDTSRVSPFANSLESTAAYLLVCKSWMRVGTPLLYSVVVLRSEAQAAALARRLSGNKDLGRVVKKLRVEGGFGLSMHVILQCTPNVTDLFLSLNIFPRDSTEGLCRGLRLISPIRLIVQNLDTRDNFGNVRSTKLARAVAKAIPNWIRLSVFEFPFDEPGCGPYITVLIHPLAKAKRLHTVVVAGSAVVYEVHAMLGECPLQKIHIKRPVSRRDLPISYNPALASILSYTVRPDAESCGELSSFALNHAFKPNPSFVPLGSASQEVQDKVWSCVLYFAMSVPERAEDPSRNDQRRRLPLLLVSKTFRRLGLPHYYVHVVLRPLVSIQFTSALSHIQTIHSRSRIIWRDFEILVKLSKTSLRECCIRVDAPRKASPDIFSDLAELQTLDWHCTASFANIPTETPVDAMPKLRNLHIRDSDQSFLAALSSMKLTSLRRFVITWNLDCNQFLRVHGTHLSEIEIALTPAEKISPGILDLCPNLVSMSLSWKASHHRRPPNMNVFQSANPAPSLTELKFLIPIEKDISPSNELSSNDLRDKWSAFFDTFLYQSVPNLHEIRVTCFVWPLTREHDISRCFWVPVAEALLALNIDLKDDEGKKWRPRLKVGGRGPA
ncbi:hypothetical protein GGX14DRAFT_651537 [Mycena pura]|uniref:Uncharacterized protein n=1 Tax=Mycena pura TaxID=153505 RepID=A0AAD6Y9A7_9AGAR|nr:hypothetical protein GGX14DRAFT_651537 [Mycena pura]